MIIVLIIGLLIGGFVGYKIHNKILMKMLDKEIITKRGLIKRSYDMSGESFETNIEFNVIDESSDMIKIKAVDIKADKSKYNDDETKKMIEELVNGWYKTDHKDIQIFKRTLKEIRNEKLKELLGE